MSVELVPMLSGALSLGYATAALFFLRFWRESRDRLFAFFAASFAMLAWQRVMVLMVDPASLLVYWIRLLAFLLILIAIFDKNRRS